MAPTPNRVSWVNCASLHNKTVPDWYSSFSPPTVPTANRTFNKLHYGMTSSCSTSTGGVETGNSKASWH